MKKMSCFYCSFIITSLLLLTLSYSAQGQNKDSLFLKPSPMVKDNSFNTMQEGNAFSINSKELQLLTEAINRKNELYSVFLLGKSNLKWDKFEADITYDCSTGYMALIDNLVGCLDGSKMRPVKYGENSKITFTNDLKQPIILTADDLNKISEPYATPSKISNRLTLENGVPWTEMVGDTIIISQKDLKPIIWHIGATIRFVGELKLDGYVIIGDGDQSKRLTFKIDEVANFVYISGEGRIIRKDGTMIKLGYN
jgi:hypothetical protein